MAETNMADVSVIEGNETHPSTDIITPKEPSDENNTNKEYINITNSEEIEKLIYKSINIVRKELCKRPDKEAIFNVLQKRYKLSSGDVGEIFDSLEETGKIFIKITKKGEPSYYVSNQNIQDTAYQPSDININNHTSITDINTDIDINETDKCFLNDSILDNITKQIQDLQKHIHDEIDNVINLVSTKLSNIERKINSKNSDQKSTTHTHNDEISFLREECHVKNSIIKTLSSINKNTEEEWKIVKHGNRPSKISKYNTDVKLANRYNVLPVEESFVEVADESDFTGNVVENRFQNLNSKNKNGRRPLIVTNNFPENDVIINRRKTVPGNTSYSEIVEKGKMTYVFGTSLIKGIRRNEFNYYLKNTHAIFKSYPGATVRELKHNIQFPLHVNTPDNVILHAGCNDISPRRDQEKLTEEEIANEIIDMAQQCRFQGVGTVIISGLICRKGQYCNSRVDKVNELLRKLCREKSFYYIDNSRITQDHLYKDGLHLLESGKVILARNFTYYLNYISDSVSNEF